MRPNPGISVSERTTVKSGSSHDTIFGRSTAVPPISTLSGAASTRSSGGLTRSAFAFGSSGLTTKTSVSSAFLTTTRTLSTFSTANSKLAKSKRSPGLTFFSFQRRSWAYRPRTAASHGSFLTSRPSERRTSLSPSTRPVTVSFAGPRYCVSATPTTLPSAVSSSPLSIFSSTTLPSRRTFRVIVWVVTKSFLPSRSTSTIRVWK